MPQNKTAKTILTLLGMAAGGFGKGALMAQMANDKNLQAKNEEEVKRKEALEDKAFEFLTSGFMDQTLPYGQRQKFGTALNQFYGNLSGTQEGQPVESPGGFDFATPYQMTPAENAQKQLQNPVTFRSIAKDMLAGNDNDPNADLKRQKLDIGIQEMESRIKVNDARVASLNRSKKVSQADKQWLTATKHKINTNLKRLEPYRNIGRMGRKAAGYDPKFAHIWQPIVEDLQQDLDALDRYYTEQTGDINWQDFEVQ